MALEDLFREAAAKGLTHFTLYPVQSEDRKSTYWAARATPSTGHSYVQAADADPVRATELVLEALPRAPKRGAKFDSVNPPLSELPQRAVTAAVTAPGHTDLMVSPEAIDEALESWLPKP